MNEKMEWNDGMCLLMMSQFDCFKISIMDVKRRTHWIFPTSWRNHLSQLYFCRNLAQQTTHVRLIYGLLVWCIFALIGSGGRVAAPTFHHRRRRSEKSKSDFSHLLAICHMTNNKKRSFRNIFLLFRRKVIFMALFRPRGSDLHKQMAICAELLFVVSPYAIDSADRFCMLSSRAER